MANKLRLQELVKVLRDAHARSEWNQEYYVSDSQEAMCGTTMCSAGHGSVMAGYYHGTNVFGEATDNWFSIGDNRYVDRTAYSIASEYFDLSMVEANVIFLTSANVYDIDDMETIINAVADDKLSELIHDEDRPIRGLHYNEAMNSYSVWVDANA